MRCSQDDEPKCCCCPHCSLDEDRKTWFTVKAFDWQVGMGRHGAGGTSYQVVEHRMIATSKCKEDAERIAEAMNGNRKLLEQLSTLRTALQCEVNKPRGGITLEQLRDAFIAEASVHCRWSTARKHVKDFYDAVLVRLKNL